MNPLEAGTQAIADYLLGTNMFIAAAAIYLLPQILRRARFIKKWMENQWMVRIMPLYPLLASVGVVLAPGAVELPDRQIGTIMIAVVWMAFLAQSAHKFIGQTLMGDDPRITTLAVKSLGQEKPVQGGDQ